MGLPVLRLTEVGGLFQDLPGAVKADGPLSFEDLHQDYGFVLYRSRLAGGRKGVLRVGAVRDYALVYIDGKRAGMIDRRLGQDSLVVDLPAGEVRLDILVENMGRIDFGQYLLENKKGILGEVRFGGEVLKGWEHFGLPMKSVGGAGGGRGVGMNSDGRGVGMDSDGRGVGVVAGDQPVLRRGRWRLSQVADTYLDMRKWGKGVVWVNGHNLGRYWSIGPQQTIYLPAEWLKKGDNEVVVLELVKTGQEELRGVDKPILDVLQ
jgi:beta-galactosidase